MLLCGAASNVSAYEYPHAFWALADRYQAALDSDNKAEIIAAGSEIVSLMESEEQNEEVQTVLGSKLYDMGYAYEALGGVENHIKAGECFEKYIPTERRWAGRTALKSPGKGNAVPAGYPAFHTHL